MRDPVVAELLLGVQAQFLPDLWGGILVGMRIIQGVFHTFDIVSTDDAFQVCK